MFDLLRKTFMGAVAALALSVSGGVSEAATVITNGGSSGISYGDDFVAQILNPSGAGSFTHTFTSVVDPLGVNAQVSVLTITGTFTGMVLSWLDGSLATLSSISVIPTTTTLATVFTIPNLTQSVRVSWTGSTTNAIAVLGVVAAVPVPAGGLLLIGALGGLAALRRRKKAA